VVCKGCLVIDGNIISLFLLGSAYLDLFLFVISFIEFSN